MFLYSILSRWPALIRKLPHLCKTAASLESDGIAMCDRFAGSERLFTGFLASDREHRGFTSSSDHRTCPRCECDSSADCVRVRTRSRDVAGDWHFRSRAYEAGP